MSPQHFTRADRGARLSHLERQGSETVRRGMRHIQEGR